MPEQCKLTILELNWNQRLGQDKIQHLLSYAHVTLSTQLQKRSFQVIERTRTSSKNVKRWKMHVQSVQKYCFSLSNVQICMVFVAAVLVVVAWAPQFSAARRTHCFCIPNMETRVPFGRAISVRQLPFAVLSDNVYWNRCIRVGGKNSPWIIENLRHKMYKRDLLKRKAASTNEPLSWEHYRARPKFY